MQKESTGYWFISAESKIGKAQTGFLVLFFKHCPIFFTFCGCVLLLSTGKAGVIESVLRWQALD